MNSDVNRSRPAGWIALMGVIWVLAVPAGSAPVSSGVASATDANAVKMGSFTMSVREYPLPPGVTPAKVKAAAAKGDLEAQTRLGEWLVDGTQGMAKDPKQGVSMIRSAADQGNAFAQNSVGVLYLLGEHYPRDVDEAARWFRKSAEQEDGAGECGLGTCYSMGWGVERDPKSAMVCYQRSAIHGDLMGQFQFGNCLLFGKGTEKNIAEGIRWIEKSAKQGMQDAVGELGLIYMAGLYGVPKDRVKGMAWIQKGAAAGIVECMTVLGECYENGVIVKKDIRAAKKWYGLAADKGFQPAQEELQRLLRKENL